jgi:hypothetical protein
MNLNSIVLEQDGIFGVQSILQVVSVENTLEFSEKIQRSLGASDNLEVLVNVLLELSLNRRDINLEVNEISIESVTGRIKKLVVLLSELLNKLVEVIKNWLDSFQVVFLKNFELLDGSEQLNQLADSSAEKIKSSEDLVWREIELLSFWHVHESLFSELILLKVSLVKLDAALKDFNELITWIFVVIPEDVITGWSTFLSSLTILDSSGVEDGELAVGDHMVGDLGKKAGHSLVGVVVSGDGVDHLDAVHQSWESLLDGLWSSFVKRFDEFFECLEVLHVVLGLVQSFGNSELDGSPS